MKILLYLLLFLSIFSVLLSAFLNYRNKADANDYNIHTLPNLIGWIGVGDVVVFSAFAMICLIVTDDSNVSAYSFPFFIFYLFILLGMYLALIAFNKKFETKQDVIIYTNCFRRNKEYAYSDFTKIYQSFACNYICYVKGKRAFCINEEFITPMIYMKSQLPKNIEYSTKESRQEATIKDGIITSKMNLGGFSIAWLNFLIAAVILGYLKLNDGIYSLIAVLWFPFALGYLVHTYLYLVKYDKGRRLLKIRHFFREKEFNLTGLKWEEVTESGIPVKIKFFNKKQKVCKVDVSIIVTNRDILIRELEGK